MIGHLGRRFATVAVLLVAVVTLTSCTRRQLIPGILAGTGAAMATSGAIYRATLDTDEPFGSEPGEIAGTTVLLFGGVGLLIAGIVWSATSSHCDENADCWSGDVCERRSHTCIDAEAARRMHNRTTPPADEGADAASSDADADDEDSDGDSDGDSEEEDEEEFDPGAYPG